MDDIQYIGEHLVPRALGEIVTVISFAAILFATISYILSLRNNSNRAYLKTARQFFSIHAIFMVSLIGLMFFVMFNRYYEYAYAFEHTSDDLPFMYMFSAFWEGQQGSFLLWMMWHLVLGFALIKKAKDWEPSVMISFCAMQTWLASMLLGVHIPFTDIKLGDNPMLLLREVVDAPIFANEDYVQLLEGKGLNLLLQNYWNVIHPPITFLGFASVTVPFSFAMAGLFTKKYTEWFRPGLPWVLFSVGILGVGILMGSAWAYEALTFGGYWAWDPVENMSLVPWIMLLAGLHAHLISQATGHSRRSVYLFYVMAFCLSIYSTYLVRSGALEDTSVHAFTEMGLGPHLTAFLAFFVLGGAYMLVKHWKHIPNPEKEESAYSREFWMFIGLMVLAISAILITYSTSLPVINKIATLINPDYEGRVIKDAIEHYNKYQLWIAVFVSTLTGVAQWLRFRDTSLPKKSVLMRYTAHALLTAAGTIAIASMLQDKTWPVISLLAAALYGVIANLDYLVSRMKSDLKMAGSMLSHVGFGVMLLGIIISGINKRQISQNPMLMAGIFNDVDNEMVMKNVILLKNEPIYSQGYLLEYVRDTFIGTERQYVVSFKKLNSEDQPIDSFVVMPNVIYSKEFDNIEVYHPSIRHTITEDIFTRIATLPKAEVDPKFAQAIEDTLQYVGFRVKLGDTINLDHRKIIVDELVRNPETESLPLQIGDKVIGVNLRVLNTTKSITYDIMPKAILRGNLSYVLPEKLNKEEIRVKLSDSTLLPYLKLPNFGAENIVDLKVGDQLEWNDITIRFKGFNKDPIHPYYIAEEGDIAIGAELVLTSKNKLTRILNPVYVIKGSEVHHIDDHDPVSGVLARFTSLDPGTETLTLSLKQLDPTFNIYVASHVARTDFVVLEALAFPGINLFWLGACLMLFGVFFSWAQRRKQV